MEELALKYDKNFVIEEYRKSLPDGCVNFRTRDMNEQFRNGIINPDPWDKSKLYIMLIFVHKFTTIKQHILDFQDQDLRWTRLFKNHLPNLIEKHLNFELNAAELVDAVLNLFFII